MAETHTDTETMAHPDTDTAAPAATQLREEALTERLERRYLYWECDADAAPPEGAWWGAVAQLVAAGSYVEALKDQEAQAALGALEGCREAGVSIEDHYQRTLASYVARGTPGHAHVVLCVGISALQLFAQNNFTGPLLGPPPETLLPGLVPEGQDTAEVREEALEALVRDTEGVYGLLQGPEYLLVGRAVVVGLREVLGASCPSVDWWCIRGSLLHQRVAHEPSPQLYELLLVALHRVENDPRLVSPTVSRDLAALYHLEAGHLHLYYYDVGRADHHFTQAAHTLGVEAQLTGALGRRTKWQTEDKAQLVLQVQYQDRPLTQGPLPGPTLLPRDLPQDVMLDDDTRLPHWQFREVDGDAVPVLRAVEQAAVLAALTLRRRSQAHDLTLDQETKAFLAALLQHPTNWCLQASALLLRCRVEGGEPRAMGRTLQQLEELVGAVARPDPSRHERLKLLGASLVLPRWELERELAKVLVRLGCTKSALDVFERLQLWEEVVACYNELQMRQRSAEVVRAQLEKGETPRLWCMLGDATDDLDCYHRAWQMSGGHSGRAQRSLGNYYYVRKDYTTAITHYEQSLQINTLQLPVWQRLAYCALQAQDWERCSRAYRRCSVLEPDSFEVWNNMSQAYLKLDQPHRAWKSLREALRCRMDSWRLWDNFMLVSTSLGYMAEALQAYGRILGLKDRHVDTQVLGRVVKAVLAGDRDPDGREVRGLYKQCAELLGRLTTQVPTHPELWYLQALLTQGRPQPDQHTRHLAMQQFKKSVAATTQVAGWEKEATTAVAALHRASFLLDATLAAVEGTPPKAALADLNAVKLCVRGVVAGVTRGQQDLATGAVVQEVQEPLATVQAKLDTLLHQLDQVKALT